MQRNFKFSSVLIIEIIQIFILILLGSIFGVNGSSELDTRSITNILYTIISSAVTVIFGLIIANGLIKDPMGGVGAYFDGINIINLRNFGVGFLINLIPSLFIFAFGLASILAIFASLRTNNYGSVFGIIIIPLIFGILSALYQILTSYRYFVGADYNDLGFAEMFKKVFTVGKDLFKETILTYLKWIILPALVYIGLIILILRPAGSLYMGAGILINLLSLLFIIFILVALIYILNQLATYYVNR